MCLEFGCAIEFRNLMNQFKEEGEVGDEVDYCKIVDKYGLFFQRAIVVLEERNVAEFGRGLILE